MAVLPFSEGQFLRVFADYNHAVWPAQLVLYSAALLTVFVLVRGRAYAGRVAAFVLALLWLWMGAVYHLTFFTTINKAAYVFGALFVLQSLMLFALGAQKPPARFRLSVDTYGVTAAALLVYSLVVYPALGYLLGRVFPAAPTFGLPCPTTIYTFGLLLCAEGRVPLRLVLIPLGWAAVGASGAFALGITEDYGLIPAGLAGAFLVVRRNRREQRHTPAAVTA